MKVLPRAYWYEGRGRALGTLGAHPIFASDTTNPYHPSSQLIIDSSRPVPHYFQSTYVDAKTSAQAMREAFMTDLEEIVARLMAAAGDGKARSDIRGWAEEAARAYDADADAGGMGGMSGMEGMEREREATGGTANTTTSAQNQYWYQAQAEAAISRDRRQRREQVLQQEEQEEEVEQPRERRRHHRRRRRREETTPSYQA